MNRVVTVRQNRWNPKAWSPDCRWVTDLLRCRLCVVSRHCGVGALQAQWVNACRSSAPRKSQGACATMGEKFDRDNRGYVRGTSRCHDTRHDSLLRSEACITSWPIVGARETDPGHPHGTA